MSDINKMIKKIFIMIVMFLIYSCNKEENNLFTKDEIKSFTSGVPEIPLFNNTNIMFVKVEKNKIGSTHVGYLYYIYKSRYINSYKNFEDFLFNALNQIIIFKETDFKGGDEIVFSISPNIKSQFETKGISILFKIYCEKHSKSYTITQKDMSSDDFFSLLYYFHISGNNIAFSDYGGYYSIKKRMIAVKNL